MRSLCLAVASRQRLRQVPAIPQVKGLLWRPAADLELRAAVGWLELVWPHQPGQTLSLRRACSGYGLLPPLA